MSGRGVCCLVFIGAGQTGINKTCISPPPACSELRNSVIQKTSWAMGTWLMDYELVIQDELG
jgi:hypothetical protein